MNNLPSVKEMEFIIENLRTWKTPDLNALLGKSVKYLRKRYVILILQRYNSLVAQRLKNPPVNAGDTGSIPESGRFPGEGNGNPLQYSCLRNLMDRGAWWATGHGIAKSRT